MKITLLFCSLILTSFSQASDSRNCHLDCNDFESIRNTVSRYPIAIDSKDFGSLDQVFADNVTANYGGSVGLLTGIKELIGTLGPL